jgi:hypothetical protein
MADYYAQVEAGFPRSKLVDRARTALGLDTDQAIGKFVRLWLAVIEAGPGGSLADRSDAWIEEAVAWRGEPGAFAKFVRDVHLDEHGVIRDWEDKYGVLDKLRRQARDRKAAQRERERSERNGTVTPLSRGHERDQGRDGPGDGHAAVLPPVTESSLLSPSSSSLVVTQEQKPVPTQEPVRRDAPPADPLIDTLERARLDPALFAPDDWVHVSGLLRASRNAFAVACTMRGHLEGEEGPIYTPKVIGRAAREFGAAGKEFNARYFAGFLRDAEKAMAGGDNSRRQGQQEARFIDHEAVQREREVREEAAIVEMLADFERRHGARYVQLQEIAEKSVGPNFKGKFRAPVVRAALVKLVRHDSAQGEEVDGE